MIKWYARIVWTSPYGGGEKRWQCGHKHGTRERAAHCGNAELRRITRGHNIAEIAHKVHHWVTV